MGYRSSVAYVIAFADEHTMGKFVNHVFGSGDEHLINALKDCEVNFDSKRINFYAGDVKWYDSYDDIKGHTRLYELCHDEDTPFFNKSDYRFIRIGEESEDIQEDCSCGDFDPYDDFYVARSIETPFNTNYTPYGDKLALLEKEKEACQESEKS